MLPFFLLLRAVCYPDISQDKVEELAYKWGNIPRFILEKVSAPRGPLVVVSSPCRTCIWRRWGYALGMDAGVDAAVLSNSDRH